jgi:hypothetical protein
VALERQQTIRTVAAAHQTPSQGHLLPMLAAVVAAEKQPRARTTQSSVRIPQVRRVQAVVVEELELVFMWQTAAQPIQAVVVVADPLFLGF